MRTACALLVGFAAVLAGCGGNKGSQATSTPSDAPNRTVLSGPARATSKVDRAATIAKAIQADPQHAEDVLRQNGMTEDQFEDLLYEIAADPEMSREYSARLGS